jgi:hypothetical protein
MMLGEGSRAQLAASQNLHFEFTALRLDDVIVINKNSSKASYQSRVVVSFQSKSIRVRGSDSSYCLVYLIIPESLNIIFPISRLYEEQSMEKRAS